MPAKIPAAKISDLKPSEAEVAEARKQLKNASAAQKRSKMASMMHFLKENPDSNVAEAKGEAKQRFLEAFICHQMKQKEIRKEKENTRKDEVEKASTNRDRWWSKEKMQIELGVKKAQSWIDSGLLEHRPDKITKEDGEWAREYNCVEDFQERINRKVDGFTIRATGDADEEDLGMCDETEKIVMKKELLTDDEKKKQDEQEKAKQIEILRADPKPTIRRFQDNELDLSKMIQDSDKKKYIGDFKQDAEKLVAKIRKTLKVLNKLATLPSSVSDDDLSRLVAIISVLDTEYGELYNWAERFGLVKSKGGKRKAS